MDIFYLVFDWVGRGSGRLLPVVRWPGRGAAHGAVRRAHRRRRGPIRLHRGRRRSGWIYPGMYDRLVHHTSRPPR